MQSLCLQKLNNEQDKQLSKQRQSLMQPLANLSCFYCNVYSDDRVAIGKPPRCVHGLQLLRNMHGHMRQRGFLGSVVRDPEAR